MLVVYSLIASLPISLLRAIASSGYYEHKTPNSTNRTRSMAKVQPARWGTRSTRAHPSRSSSARRHRRSIGTSLWSASTLHPSNAALVRPLPRTSAVLSRKCDYISNTLLQPATIMTVRYRLGFPGGPFRTTASASCSCHRRLDRDAHAST